MNKVIYLLVSIITIYSTSSFACDQNEIEKTSNPLPEESREAYQQAIAINEIASKSLPPKLIIIGDSLVSRWPIDLIKAPTKIQNVLKMGVEGDKTQNVLWRLNSKSYNSWKPDVVVLLIGTNNLAAGDSACAISFAINKIVLRIDSLWASPRLVLMSLLPRGEDWSFREEDRQEINKAINDIAKSRMNTSVVNYTKDIICYSELPCRNFMPDKLHLTSNGYEIMTTYLKNNLLNR